MKRVGFFFVVIYLILTVNLSTQASWKLWASGLPAGEFPKLAIAPNHDIFYGLTGTPGPKGIVFNQNTTDPRGKFKQRLTFPVPASNTNNIKTRIFNQQNYLIAGIFRSNAADRFIFYFIKKVKHGNMSLLIYC